VRGERGEWCDTIPRDHRREKHERLPDEHDRPWQRADAPLHIATEEGAESRAPGLCRRNDYRCEHRTGEAARQKEHDRERQWRSACTGSIRAARRARMQLATAATAGRVVATPMRVTGSRGGTS